MPFNKAIAPGKKPFDFAINQVSYTPARAKVLAFSASYYNVNQSIVGLKGKPIASVRSIAGLQQVQARRAARHDELPVHRRHDQADRRRPRVYDTNDAAVAALKNGQIDGLVVDLPTAFYVTRCRCRTAKIVGQFAAKGTQERFGMVFQKGNPLVGCVNKALAQHEAQRRRSSGSSRSGSPRSTGAPVLK